MDPYLGEIRCFAFGVIPSGWLECNGQLLSIQQYAALYSLIGTQFGGDAKTNFALPNLSGRVPLHYNLPEQINVGAMGGQEAVTLAASQVPAHNHLVAANTNAGDQATANNFYFAALPSPHFVYGSSSAPQLALATDIVGSAGGGAAHPNMQPFLVLSFCIATSGLYPARP